MLNDNYGCAIVKKGLKDAKQYPHIQRMQADRRFIKHKDGILLCLADLTGQLQPLCFSARQAGRFLAQRQVAQTQLFQNVQLLADGFHVLAEIDRRVDIQLHQLRQRNAFACLVREFHIVSRSCIARTAAIRARNVHIRQELYIQTDDARSVAAGAAERAGVIGKVACFVAPLLCISGFCI